jgi:hypothetical protein
MDYEFTESENKVIQRAGEGCGLYGQAAIALGLLGMVGGLAATVTIQHPRAVPLGIGVAFGLLPTVLGGFWYITAGKALRDVVNTQGDDITHMMVALERIAAVFKLEGIVSLIAFVIGLVASIALVGSHTQ